MQYINHYPSPFGGILLAADETGLSGLWFDGAKHYAAGLDPEQKEQDTPVLDQTKEWLTVYSYLEFLCNFAVSGHIHIHLFAQCDHIKQ